MHTIYTCITNLLLNAMRLFGIVLLTIVIIRLLFFHTRILKYINRTPTIIVL